MGMYMYISEEETKRMKEVIQDEEVNELLQEALQYNDTLLIEANYFYRKKEGYKGWLLGKKEKDFEYQVYHESRAFDGTAYQARYQLFGSSKRQVMNYLYGIINGGTGMLRIQDKQYKKEVMCDPWIAEREE